jgi:hypothetical protein
MNSLRYSLRGDGPWDIMLMPILAWLLDRHLPDVEFRAQFADVSAMPKKSSKGLVGSIVDVLNCYPCDLLFIHRDAEKQDFVTRQTEIREALEEAGVEIPSICVIPVRMSEAWLLFDENAIRSASGNPNGKSPLHLPSMKNIEAIADPKDVLCASLRIACELSGRRLKQFRPIDQIPLVAEWISDFSPLRGLPAFGRLEAEIQAFSQRYYSEHPSE